VGIERARSTLASVAAAVLALGLVAGCSDGGLGSCRRIDGADESDPFPGFLTAEGTWYWVDEIGPISRPATYSDADRTVSGLARLEPARDGDEPWSGELYAHDLTGDDMASALDDGMRVAVLAKPTQRYEPYVLMTVALDGDGVHFLGECASRYDDDLRGMVEAFDPPTTPSDAVEEFVAEGASSQLGQALRDDIP
jgi:hypothetical protein